MAEPEFGGREDFITYGVMVGSQALIWAWLYNKHGPLRGPLHRCIENMDGAAEVLKVQGLEVGNWSYWMIVALHHGLGGLLALIGASMNNIFLFRFGLSFEIGEDFLHYTEMLYTLLCPPGTETFGELWPDCKIWLGLAFHHTIGSVAGSFVFIFIPNWPDAQYCVVLLLISAVPQLIQFPFMPFENLKGEEISCIGKVAAFMTIIGTGFALVARVVLFPVAVWRVSGDVRAAYGNIPANVILTVSGLFMIFALGTFFLLSFNEVIHSIKNLCSRARQEGVIPAVKSLVGKEGREAMLAATEAQTFVSVSADRRRSMRSVGVEITQEGTQRATLNQ